MARRAQASANSAGIEALGTLQEQGFSSSALLDLVQRHGAQAERGTLAAGLVAAYLDAWTREPLDVELPTQVATAVVLLVGSTAVPAVLTAAARGVPSLADDLEAETALLILADQAGYAQPADKALPPLPAAEVEPLVALVDAGEEAWYDLMVQLLLAPGPMRHALLDAILRLGARKRATLAFAAFARFGALDEACLDRLDGWLAGQKGPIPRWVAKFLADEARGPCPVEALGLGWPVVAAYASFPDGSGSQGLSVVRRRPDGRLAFGSAVVNDWRGVAEGMGVPQIAPAELDELLTSLHESSGLVQVPAAYVAGRLEQGLAWTDERGLPLPFMLRLHWHMFQGLPAAPELDLADAVARWANPKDLAATEALADEPFFVHAWYYDDGGPPAVRAFFQASRDLLVPKPGRRKGQLAMLAMAMQVLEPDPAAEAALARLISRSLDAFFDEEARRRWADRLAQVAYLYHQAGQPKLGRLAATAARALAPDSGVPLTKQPIPALILHQSAYLDAQQADRALERTFSPPGAKGGSVYQLKIALKGARPPIWRRVLVPADASLARLHEVIQAAMGWDGYHLHAFRLHGVEYGPRGSEFADRDEARVQLGEVLVVGDKLAYEYDFGDGWQHQLTVEKVLPVDPQLAYPLCLKGKGACPPEDSGGLWGYYEKLDVLADPADPDHEEVAGWMGEGFDPEAFDLDAANARLAYLRPDSGRKRKSRKKP